MNSTQERIRRQKAEELKYEQIRRQQANARGNRGLSIFGASFSPQAPPSTLPKRTHTNR